MTNAKKYRKTLEWARLYEDMVTIMTEMVWNHKKQKILRTGGKKKEQVARIQRIIHKRS